MATGAVAPGRIRLRRGVAATVVAVGLASCAPAPAPEPQITLGSGFEPGAIALIVAPEGLPADSGIAAGWGRLATGPDCRLLARAGERPAEPGDDQRDLTRNLLEVLAAEDDARSEVTEAELTSPDAPAVPVLAGSWDGPDGPVRALARVTIAYQFSGDLDTRAVAIQLRCSDDADIDGLWDDVTHQVRVQWPPSAGTWDHPEGSGDAGLPGDA